MIERRRSWWGWGWEGEGPNAEQRTAIARNLAGRFGAASLPVAAPPELKDVELRQPRIGPPQSPPSLAAICSTETYDRAGHSYGNSCRDIVRGFAGQFPRPPDVVVFPQDEADVAAALDWCGEAGVAAILY